MILYQYSLYNAVFNYPVRRKVRGIDEWPARKTTIVYTGTILWCFQGVQFSLCTLWSGRLKFKPKPRWIMYLSIQHGASFTVSLLPLFPSSSGCIGGTRCKEKVAASGIAKCANLYPPYFRIGLFESPKLQNILKFNLELCTG